MNNLISVPKDYREKLLSDPYRPRYHFAIPEDNGYPGDPNGAFFADGRYHLMYLYNNTASDSYCWGHISSTDLLHWQRHPDALTSEDGDRGCYSGGAFKDDDGTAYIAFWKFPSKDFQTDNGGIAIAYSKPPYDNWERITPIAINSDPEVWGSVDIDVNGQLKHIGCADPSNIWKENNCYYMQTGNKIVLHTYGYTPNSPDEYKGDHTDLFKSYDMKNWTYVHRFYDNPHIDSDYPDQTEDDMCPGFLPIADKKSGGKLTGKWLQTFISHNKGSQYYVGELKNEKFYPELHGRFTWNDNTCFAPESLIDDKNRHIAWFWLLDNPKNDFERFGWSGVFSFPRVFWLENDILHMTPADELDNLQYGHEEFDLGKVNSAKPFDIKNGESFRIKADIDMQDAEKAGFSVRISPDGKEHTDIYFDKIKSKLVFDATESGCDGRMIKEESPFELFDGEKLHMDIFVDKSVVEVYVNERQTICRRVYPTSPKAAVNVTAISNGAEFGKIDVWQMMPSNPY